MSDPLTPWQFPLELLQQIDWLTAGWIGRLPTEEKFCEGSNWREIMRPHHRNILATSGVNADRMWHGEQIHGNQIRRIPPAEKAASFRIAGVDGLVTATPGEALGVYVADCCAVYLIDIQQKAIGLCHSGRKGTELSIVTCALKEMERAWGSRTGKIIAVLSPCIHACCYEVDFASHIVTQLRDAGVRQIHSSRECTGCHTELNYSYRKEKGATGRMLAWMKIRS